MVVGSILMAVLLGQQAKIDFECRAATLTAVLRKLSRTTGETYRPDPAMAGEVVCIRANQVPLTDLLDKIAEATACQWRDDQGAQVLFRSKETTIKYDQQDYENRAAWIKKLLEPKRKELAKLAKPYERAVSFMESLKTLQKTIDEHPRGVSLDGPRLAAPASVLTQQLINDLDPQTIAAVPVGKSWTFSNDPTPAQRSLGPNTKRYIQEYLETDAQLSGMLPEKPQSGMMQGLLDDVYSSAKSTDGVGKVLLTVRHSGSILSFSCTVYTEQGKSRCWGFTNTYQLGDDPWAREREAGVNDKPVMADVSDGTALFAKYAEKNPDVARFPGEVKSHPWDELPDTMKKLLRAPDEYDPLSFALTDGCFAMADESKKPMVAYLSDAEEKAGSLAIKDGKLNLARFKSLLRVKGAEISDDGPWTLIKQRNPNYASRYRLSRAAFGKFMKTAVDSRSIDLQPFSRLHYESGMPMQFSSIARLYRKTLTLYGANEMPDIDQHSSQAYQFLGSLSPMQWKQLYDGQSIRVGDGTMGTREAALNWMQEGAFWLVMDPKANLPDLYEHWTEYAPNGLPTQAYVTLAEKAVHGIDPVNKIQLQDGTMTEDVMGMGRGTEPSVLATSWAKGGYYKSFEHLMEGISKSKFQYIERTDLNINLFLLPTHKIVETFSGAPTQKKRVTYDQLPENVKKEFEDAAKQAFNSGAG